MQRNFIKHVQTSWKTLQMKPGGADVEEAHGGDEWSRKAVWVREGVAFKASLLSNAGCSLAVKTKKSFVFFISPWKLLHCTDESRA